MDVTVSYSRYTREYLQSLSQGTNKRDYFVELLLAPHIEAIKDRAATGVKTSYTFTPFQKRTPDRIHYNATVTDIVEVLQKVFPGCVVTTGTRPVSNPGFRLEEDTITVDWS